MEKDHTKLEWLKKEITAWREGLMNRPIKTLLLGLVFIILIGLTAITPRIFNDIYSYLVHQKPEKPFSSKQTIYSNFIPLNSDYIDLDKSGTLIPSPYNKYFDSSKENICSPDNQPLIDYSQGIVLILNLPATYTSRDLQNPTKPVRGIMFAPPPKSTYYTFKLGDIKEINTGGRKFSVKLSSMNDLSTIENGIYFSYVFEINEE